MRPDGPNPPLATDREIEEQQEMTTLTDQPPKVAYTAYRVRFTTRDADGDQVYGEEKADSRDAAVALAAELRVMQDAKGLPKDAHPIAMSAGGSWLPCETHDARWERAVGSLVRAVVDAEYIGPRERSVAFLSLRYVLLDDHVVHHPRMSNEDLRRWSVAEAERLVDEYVAEQERAAEVSS